MGKLLDKWSNLLYVPLVLLLIIVFGVMGEVSAFYRYRIGLPFFLSIAIGILTVVLALIASWQMFIALRRLVQWLIRDWLQRYAQNDNQSD